MSLNLSLHSPWDHLFKICPVKRLTMCILNFGLKWFFRCAGESFHGPPPIASVISGMSFQTPLSPPPCPTAFCPARVSGWTFCLGQVQREFLHFFSSSNKDGGWRSGEAHLADEGQVEIFDSKAGWGSITFSYVELVFIPHFLLQITLVRRDNAADTQDFSHITLQTQTPLSGEPKRNFWASTSPPFVWRLQRTQSIFNKN